MNRTLPLLLFACLGLMATWSSGARATTLGDGDYARVGVPDLAQAAAFFHDVLDCRPIGSSTTAAATATRLLSCGGGSMLELFVDRGDSPARITHAKGDALQFVTDDALRTDAWLRQRGVAVSGAPHRLTSGPWTGRMALDFVAPWGLRIRLLGGKMPDAAEDGVHTMAAAPRGN